MITGQRMPYAAPDTLTETESLKNMKKHAIANYFTAIRMVGTICLLPVRLFSTAFYVIYTVCGVSDVVDGVIARATGTTSEFGARLDSIADLSFYTVIVVRLLPSLWKRLPGWFWYLLGAALLVRLASYVAAAVKFHRFASVHTYCNKLTGLAVFSIAYLAQTPALLPACLVTVSIALLASLEELALHLTGTHYQANRKSILIKPGREKALS